MVIIEIAVQAKCFYTIFHIFLNCLLKSWIGNFKYLSIMTCFSFTEKLNTNLEHWDTFMNNIFLWDGCQVKKVLLQYLNDYLRQVGRHWEIERANFCCSWSDMGIYYNLQCTNVDHLLWKNLHLYFVNIN